MRDPRCILVDTKDAKVGALLAKLATALAPHVPEPYATKLRHAHGGVRKVAELMASDLYKQICPAYEVKLQQRHDFFVTNGLGGVDSKRFVGVPLDTMDETLVYLKSVLGMNPQKIASFPQLLTQRTDVNLIPKVAYLQSELHIKPDIIASWPQLLVYSVEDDLKPTVDYLKYELGIKPEKIASYPKLLANSVEAKLRPTVDYLKYELGIKSEQIASWPPLL